MNNNLIYLQVQGQSKLVKEIEETKNMDNKKIDDIALHRNEKTLEIEGTYDQSKSKSVLGVVKKVTSNTKSRHSYGS